MPEAINSLEDEAGTLGAEISRLQDALETERLRLAGADSHVHAIEAEFLRVLLAIGFPGVSEDDRIVLNTNSWVPHVYHAAGSGTSEWSFFDAGSGGKKVMFNVCFALSVHRVASHRNLPLPSLLVIDTPTKNISPDVNPELVTAFYREVYELLTSGMADTQVVLIDSELVSPDPLDTDFVSLLMDGTEAHPALLPGYEGP